MHPYSVPDTATAWEKSRFIYSERSDFYMIDNQATAFIIFIWYKKASFSVD